MFHDLTTPRPAHCPTNDPYPPDAMLTEELCPTLGQARHQSYGPRPSMAGSIGAKTPCPSRPSPKNSLPASPRLFLRAPIPLSGGWYLSSHLLRQNLPLFLNASPPPPTPPHPFFPPTKKDKGVKSADAPRHSGGERPLLGAAPAYHQCRMGGGKLGVFTLVTARRRVGTKRNDVSTVCSPRVWCRRRYLTCRRSSAPDTTAMGHRVEAKLLRSHRPAPRAWTRIKVATDDSDDVGRHVRENPAWRMEKTG